MAAAGAVVTPQASPGVAPRVLQNLRAAFGPWERDPPAPQQAIAQGAQTLQPMGFAMLPSIPDVPEQSQEAAASGAHDNETANQQQQQQQTQLQHVVGQQAQLDEQQQDIAKKEELLQKLASPREHSRLNTEASPPSSQSWPLGPQRDGQRTAPESAIENEQVRVMEQRMVQDVEQAVSASVRRQALVALADAGAPAAPAPMGSIPVWTGVGSQQLHLASFQQPAGWQTPSQQMQLTQQQQQQPPLPPSPLLLQQEQQYFGNVLLAQQQFLAQHAPLAFQAAPLAQAGPVAYAAWPAWQYPAPSLGPYQAVPVEYPPAVLQQQFQQAFPGFVPALR